METIIKINIDECCLHYKIEKSFILELSENEIIEILEEDEAQFIDEDALGLLEKSIEFKNMGVNVPGIDVILNLLEKVNALNQELRLLRTSH